MQRTDEGESKDAQFCSRVIIGAGKKKTIITSSHPQQQQGASPATHHVSVASKPHPPRAAGRKEEGREGKDTGLEGGTEGKMGEGEGWRGGRRKEGGREAGREGYEKVLGRTSLLPLQSRLPNLDVLK